MVCKECGAEIMDGAKTCVVCGAVQDGAGAQDAPRTKKKSSGEQVPAFEVPVRDEVAAGGVGADGPSASGPEFVVPQYDDVVAADVTSEAPEFEFEIPAPRDDADFTPSTEPVRVRRKVRREEDPVPARPRWLPIAIAAVLLCGAGGAYAMAYSRAHAVEPVAQKPIVAKETPKPETPKKQPEEPAAPAAPAPTHEVAVPLYAEGLGADSSRVPVQVKGTAADGSAFDQQTYLSYSGKGLVLPAGQFEISVIASPISTDGILYELPSEAYAVKVLEDGKCETAPDVDVVLEVIAGEDVTDEMIEKALEWVRKDPERKDLAEELGEAARNRRDNALADQSAQTSKTTEEDKDTSENRAEDTDTESQQPQSNQNQGNQQYDTTTHSTTTYDTPTYDYDYDYTDTGSDSGSGSSTDSGSSTTDGGGSSDSGSSDSGSSDSGSGGDSGGSSGGETGGDAGGDTGGSADAGGSLAGEGDSSF